MTPTRSPVTSLTNKTPDSTASHSQQTIPYSETSKDNSEKLQNILESFRNDTIDTADIVSHRQQLILLGVNRYSIIELFRKFQNRVFMSSRTDREARLQAIKDSGKKTQRIQCKSTRITQSDNTLFKQAMSGTLPLNKIEDLRNSLLKTHDSCTASARLYRAKISLIKHNKHKESQIKAAFHKLAPKKSQLSNECKYLQTKIKKGNLSIQEFTSIYEDIPQDKKTGTLSKVCSKYIKEQSDKATTEEHKLNLLKSLPKCMQKSTSVMHILFPTISNIMSSIRTGKMQSIEIKNHLPSLLKIITTQHLLTILNAYKSKIKPLSARDKYNLLECRQYIKHLPQSDTQVIIPTHQSYESGAQKRGLQHQKDTCQTTTETTSKQKKRKLDIKHLPQSDPQVMIPTHQSYESGAQKRGLQHQEDTCQTTTETTSKQKKRKLDIKHLPQSDPQVMIPTHQSYESGSQKRGLQHQEDTCQTTTETTSKQKKRKLDLAPEAKDILESLRSCTIPVERIVPARIQLLSLRVEKEIIRNAFKSFKHKIQLSDKNNKEQIIKEISLSGQTTKGIQTAKINSTSEQLYALSTTALTDISTINIQKLRNFLFDNYDSPTASSKLHYFKNKFIKKKPTKSKEIQEAFSQASKIKPITSQPSITLRNAIRTGNLPIKEFTSLYNAIPTAVERGYVQKTCSTYVHNLAQPSLNLTEKLEIVRSLPNTLQTSQTVFKSFFPDLHEAMLHIKTGAMASSQLKQTCTSLLDITSRHVIRKLLSKYVKNKQTITTAEKQHVSECKKMLLDISTTVQETPSNNNSSTEKQPIHCSSDQPGHSSWWYTDIQQVHSKMVCNKVHEQTGSPPQQTSTTATEEYTHEQPITQASTYTYPTSPQPSTSYSIAIESETYQSFSLEQISSNELTYILQSIVDEDEYSDNNPIQQNLIQLVQELQQEADTVEQSTSQPPEEKYNPQPHTYTEMINSQNTNTDEPIYDNYNNPQPIHTDFLDINELFTNYNNDNLDQLTDDLENTIPLKEMAPEEFFDFDLDELINH